MNIDQLFIIIIILSDFIRKIENWELLEQHLILPLDGAIEQE